MSSEDWRAEAACNGKPPEWWFVELHSGGDYSKARAVCITCPVQEACGRYATENQIRFGMWGGIVRGRAARDIARRKQPGTQPDQQRLFCDYCAKPIPPYEARAGRPQRFCDKTCSSRHYAWQVRVAHHRGKREVSA